MWITKQQGIMVKEDNTLINIDGLQWEVSCKTNNEEISSAINRYYHEQAKRGFLQIYGRGKYSKSELIDNLNFVKDIFFGKLNVEIRERPTGKIHIVTLSEFKENVTLKQLESWLEGKEEIPYSVFIALRAAANKKFMTSQKIKKGLE